MNNLNENFNRIEGGTPSQLRGGASVGDSNKFYNKKLQMALAKHVIDIEMGYLTNWGEIGYDKYKDDIGLDLALPTRFGWTEFLPDGGTILHYSTMEKFSNCANSKEIR